MLQHDERKFIAQLTALKKSFTFLGAYEKDFVILPTIWTTSEHITTITRPNEDPIW